jgi:hypothetical protein
MLLETRLETKALWQIFRSATLSGDVNSEKQILRFQRSLAGVRNKAPQFRIVALSPAPTSVGGGPILTLEHALAGLINNQPAFRDRDICRLLLV